MKSSKTVMVVRMLVKPVAVVPQVDTITISNSTSICVANINVHQPPINPIHCSMTLYQLAQQIFYISQQISAL